MTYPTESDDDGENVTIHWVDDEAFRHMARLHMDASIVRLDLGNNAIADDLEAAAAYLRQLLVDKGAL